MLGPHASCHLCHSEVAHKWALCSRYDYESLLQKFRIETKKCFQFLSKQLDLCHVNMEVPSCLHFLLLSWELAQQKKLIKREQAKEGEAEAETETERNYTRRSRDDRESFLNLVPVFSDTTVHPCP